MLMSNEDHFLRRTDLQALGTDPARQRQRAAMLLVKWAVRVSDEKGSRTTVEASKVATNYGLYSKQDFREFDTYNYIDEQRFPNFGGQGCPRRAETKN